MFYLTVGNIKIYIKCFDEHGAYSKSEITVLVNDTVVTAVELTKLGDENKKSIEIGNYDEFFGKLSELKTN